MIAADSWRLIGDVHPSEQALILRRGRDRIESSFCNWGYPAKEQGGLVINARAETLLEKPLFCEDTLHRHGLKTVMVTGGLATVETCERLRGKIDAMNIDLKAFSDRFYKELIGGDRRMVMDFIECAHSFAHIELTCLIIPGENDDPEEMDAMAGWIASLPEGEEIPLHVSRFFPRYHMQDRPPTDVDRVYALAETAAKHLKYVYTGNC